MGSHLSVGLGHIYGGKHLLGLVYNEIKRNAALGGDRTLDGYMKTHLDTAGRPVDLAAAFTTNLKNIEAVAVAEFQMTDQILGRLRVNSIGDVALAGILKTKPYRELVATLHLPRHNACRICFFVYNS
eukprot:NODE_2538_length_465_cov_582.769231_g2096_i0.p1 GENE.NODE_2538_length_465_cov_582.769231_g2096_i0~~NODE_2538_length_465_cov_582.769231_g2096_i0.p1  ORF type:complete len:138 (-),score=20.05 NODE_2538_length_465_cov_582.769231_g2096_i0:51-434(-)